MKRGQKGSMMEPVLLLVGLSIVIFLFILPTRTPGPKRSIFDFSDNPSGTFREPYKVDDVNPYSLQPSSTYSSSISIGRGNASSAYQPFEEYITIRNRGRSPLNLTGWRLTNGRDRRIYEIDGNIQRYPAEEAYIPSGTKLLSTSKVLQGIILEPGEEAVITSGKPISFGPLPVTSFKENICTGYLSSDNDYSFIPTLTRQCPKPSTEPGFASLPEDCQNFIENMASCHVPDIGGRDRDGQRCDNCVDGKRLSSSCVAFIESHYTYQGCVANHALDKNFFLGKWRVYLGRTWEMWAKRDEVVSLFDSAGNLVDYLEY